MKNRIGLAALMLLVLMAGCATTPPPESRLKPVPREQVVALPIVKTTAPALVRVTRDEGYIGSAVFVHLSLDNRKVAALNPGEYVEFPVDAGDYLLSVIPTDPFGGRHPTTQEVVWKAGAKYRYRVGIDGNMAVTLGRQID